MLGVDGSIVSTGSYDPFGYPLDTTGSVSSLGFQGDFTDPVTGDEWMGARWFDPGSAQFRSRDAVFGLLASPVSLNRYTYLTRTRRNEIQQQTCKTNICSCKVIACWRERLSM